MVKVNDLDYLSEAESKAFLTAVHGSRDLAIIRLFLGTGIRLNELEELNIDSIIWDKKLLRIVGARSRDIPINDELLDALTAWSHERIDNHSEALFVTQKGKLDRLTSRGIDKLLRKYGLEAGIKQPINAQILRNTFAVRLFSKETTIDNASAILGNTEPKSIRRFMKAAKAEKDGKIPVQDLEKLDTRPKIIKHFSKLVRRKPKESKIIPLIAPSEKEEITVGRDSVLSEIRENISKELATLLVGPLGIGKTHLLKKIAEESLNISGVSPCQRGDGRRPEGILYLDSPTPIKQFLQKICEKYCPDWSQRLPSKSRSSTKEITELLTNVLKGKEKKDVLIIDNLDSIKSSDIEILLPLFENFIILSAAEETPSRLKEIWWKFRRIDLLPLTPEASKELIKILTNGLTIADYTLLETRILTIANGLPLSIVEMIGQIHHLPVIKNDDVRSIYHEAGIKYRDWSPLILIILTVATSSRFISLGTQSVEGYILALVGMVALSSGIKFLRSR